MIIINKTNVIQTLEEAFQILDNEKYDIPLEAIEFIYNHPINDQITDKIIFALKNANNYRLHYSDEEDWYSQTPLSYLITAEAHLSEQLFKPMIEVFLQEDSGSDAMLEQCSYLVGKLAKKYPDQFIPLAFDAIEIAAISEELSSYNYLFEVLNFADLGKYKKRMLNLLTYPNFSYLDAYISEISTLPIPEMIPILEKLQEETKKSKGQRNSYHQNHLLIEIEEAIKIQKGAEDPFFSPGIIEPYSETRGSWKEHYQKIHSPFLPPIEPPKPVSQKPVSKKKIGRNDRCYCGSGKKYKKCCMPQ